MPRARLDGKRSENSHTFADVSRRRYNFRHWCGYVYAPQSESIRCKLCISLHK